MNLLITNNQKLLRKFKRMFKCDSVRISKPYDTMFIVIGFKKNTKDRSEGVWFQNGEPLDFDYIEEKVIATGKTEEELIKSAKFFKKIQNMSMNEFLELKNREKYFER